MDPWTITQSLVETNLPSPFFCRVDVNWLDAISWLYPHEIPMKWWLLHWTSQTSAAESPPGPFEASSRATWGVFRGRCRFYLGKARVSKRKRDYVTKICFLVDLNLDFACKYGLWSLYYYGTIGGDMGPRVAIPCWTFYLGGERYPQESKFMQV